MLDQFLTEMCHGLRGPHSRISDRLKSDGRILSNISQTILCDRPKSDRRCGPCNCSFSLEKRLPLLSNFSHTRRASPLPAELERKSSPLQAPAERLWDTHGVRVTFSRGSAPSYLMAVGQRPVQRNVPAAK